MEGERGDNTRWMDLASAGDTAAFGEVARHVQDGLFRFARAHGLGPADAADATQETLLRAYRRRSSWRLGSDVSSWLYGIAMNVVRETWRRRRHAAPAGFSAACLAAPPADDDGPTPDELARLGACVAALPARQREAVACRFLRRMSVRQTATVMGCAEGTVKAAVFAAMKNLRSAMRAETPSTMERA